MKLTSKTINYTVDTVAQLLLTTGTENDTVIVTDENQGGVFIYREDNASTNNGGTIFNGWSRQYDGAVNVKWFGAKGDGVTDDTVAIQNAIDYCGINNKSLFLNGTTFCISDSISSLYKISIIGLQFDYLSYDNSPSNENIGTTIKYIGDINTNVFDFDLRIIKNIYIKNVAILVPQLYNATCIRIIGSNYLTQGGTYSCSLDNVAVIRDGVISPTSTNATGILLDAGIQDPNGVCFFGSSLHNIYCFNLYTGIKLNVVNNSVIENFINSNSFFNIKLYQCFISINLIAGTGANAIWRNSFNTISIQNGTDIVGNKAISTLNALGMVTDNTFVNSFVWDSPLDNFLSGMSYLNNIIGGNYNEALNVSGRSFMQDSVTIGERKVNRKEGTLQVFGSGNKSNNTGQITIYDKSDSNRQVRFGYDSTSEVGYIQATKAGVANKPLLLNPNGGDVFFTPTNGVVPTINGTMVFEYLSNTAIKLKFKGSDGIVRSATLTLT